MEKRKEQWQHGVDLLKGKIDGLKAKLKDAPKNVELGREFAKTQEMPFVAISARRNVNIGALTAMIIELCPKKVATAAVLSKEAVDESAPEPGRCLMMSGYYRLFGFLRFTCAIKRRLRRICVRFKLGFCSLNGLSLDLN